MDEAVAKYEAWAGEIKGQLEAYAKLRKQVRYFPLFALLTAPFGLFASPAVAFMIALAWLGLWGTTLYITYMRTWQYKAELQKTYDEVRRLREDTSKGG
jgi:hypothetical protein